MKSDEAQAETGIYTKYALVAFFVLTCIVTTSVTAYYAPADWSYLRIFGAGVVGGAWCYMCVFINHMLAFPLDPETP